MIAESFRIRCGRQSHEQLIWVIDDVFFDGVKLQMTFVNYNEVGLGPTAPRRGLYADDLHRRSQTLPLMVALDDADIGRINRILN